MFIRLISLLMTITVLLSCNQQNTIPNSTIRAIKVTSKFGLVNPGNGKTEYIEDSGKVLYYKDLIAYNDNIQSGMQFRNETIAGENENRYFIFQKDSTYGIEYAPFTKILEETRKRVDSVSYLIPGTELSSFFDLFQNKDSMILIQTEGNKQDGSFIEKYIPVRKNISNDFDTVYLYFNTHLNDIPFSFISRFDNLNKAKLYRIHSVFKPVHSKDTKPELEWREFIFDMKEEAVHPQTEEAIKYFRKYETEILKRE